MGQDPFKERPVILAYTYGEADATRGIERNQDEQNTEHCANQHRDWQRMKTTPMAITKPS